ncbi:transglycosylase SLT domain-containing protein [Sneathiella sp.]|uniref:transglycosylase SLT domain-containing protein n=1 Tax=Sneathiella sp. TaxID=1964365 RepID=UPI003562059F
MRSLVGTLILLFIWIGASPAIAVPFSPKAADRKGICHEAVAAAETKYRLPKRLLTALSLTESGRWQAESKEMIAWPWTVYAEGKGRYLPSKSAAIDEVKMLQAKGVTNIDVGCMQINLHYHPEAFDDLGAALDPGKNTQYAAELLKKLRDESRSWNIAIAHYHSRTKEFNVPYRQKVLKIWQKERRKDTDARMATAREEYRKRREKLQERIEEASKRRFTQAAAKKQLANADPS